MPFAASNTKPPAVSRVLIIPELVHLILEHLAYSDLARVARVAKLLHAAAASYIWRHLNQNTISHLLVLVVGTNVQNANDTMDARWSRFYLYASFVRSLTLQFDELALVDSLRLAKDLHALSSLRLSDHTLLPNLRTLDFRARTADDVSSAALFLGPALYHAGAYCAISESALPPGTWDVHIAAFLHKLRHEAPHLAEFDMYGVHSFDPLVANAVAFLIRTTPLKSFGADLVILQPSILTKLAQSRTLTRLDVGDITCDISHALFEPGAFRATIDPRSFSSLTCLGIESHSAVAFHLLASLRHVHLQELTIKLAEQTLPSPLFQAMFSFIPDFAATLTQLNIEIHELTEEPSIDKDLSWQTFNPLLKCRGIKSFTFNIESWVGLTFQDRDILQLSRAWADLTSLTITWFSKFPPASSNRSGLRIDSEITLKALGYLAQNCRNLTDIELSYIHARAPIPALPADLRPSCKLKELHVGRSRIDCPVTVALYLILLWPAVKIYHSLAFREEADEGESDTEDASEWDQVRRMLRLVRCVREVEGNSALLEAGESLSAMVNNMRAQW